MAGNLYENGLWVSQGRVDLVNEEVTLTPTDNAQPGATRQFAAGQVGKKINLTDPTNSGSLLPNEYQYVLRNESTALAGHQILTWSDPTDGLFGVELANPGTPNGVPAGIFLGNDFAALGQRGMQDGNYGYIQIGGAIQLLSGGLIAAGADVTYTNLGLAVQRTAFTEPLVAVALEAATTGDSVWCLLDLISVD